MQTPEAAWCGAAYSEEKRVRYRLRPAAAPSPRPQKSGAGIRQWRAKLQGSRLRPETRETASKWRSKPPPWQRKIVRAEMPARTQGVTAQKSAWGIRLTGDSERRNCN